MAAETKYGILKPLEFEQASGSNLAAYLHIFTILMIKPNRMPEIQNCDPTPSIEII